MWLLCGVFLDIFWLLFLVLIFFFYCVLCFVFVFQSDEFLPLSSIVVENSLSLFFNMKSFHFSFMYKRWLCWLYYFRLEVVISQGLEYIFPTSPDFKGFYGVISHSSNRSTCVCDTAILCCNFQSLFFRFCFCLSTVTSHG